ncbi:MAG: hypothetical protein ACFFD4_18225 [Candidatus Odinarchaeota archaeon]
MDRINMVNDIMLYLGSIALVFWGTFHILPVKSIVKGYGDTSEDNKHIITMEWIAGGLGIIFLGALVGLTTLLGGSEEPVSILVYWLSGTMLVILTGLHLLTGFRTSIIPMKICPAILGSAAVLILLATVL